MAGERVERRLAAILAADVAGYSRLMGQDEAGTLARLKALRRDLIDPQVAEHKGRVVKTTGDGLLIEFPSIVEAVACAVAVQQGMNERNAGVSAARRIEFRIGINSGDVIVEDSDIHGDGVNIAARLEGIAEPGGICVSAIVHDQVQGRVDCGFEDMGEQSLKNIARPVRVYKVGPTNPHPNPPPPAGEGVPRDSGGREGAEAALPLPDKPSIAVLPFQNISGDPEQEYFADGMVEEIITALSRIRWLFVIARNSTFTYKGQAIDVKRVGRELGVRYLLEGSVRKGGGRVRITAQLVEAETGSHLWADRFDGSLEDVFDLQDQIATSVAGIIEPTLEAAETRRSLQRPTADLTAYELYLRAREDRQSWERDRVIRAVGLLDQAIARDPRYAPALAFAAHCRQTVDICDWTDDPTANRQTAIRSARQALQLGADDPAILTSAGIALGYFGENIDAALRLVDRALALNPSYSWGWQHSAYLNLYAGRTGIAINRFETALRLDPRGNRGYSLAPIGIAHFLDKRFEDALETLRLALEEAPLFVTTHRFLTACYAHMGRHRDASELVERLRAITPDVLQSATRYAMCYRSPEHRELLLSGLRLAMGEIDAGDEP